MAELGYTHIACYSYVVLSTDPDRGLSGLRVMFRGFRFLLGLEKVPEFLALQLRYRFYRSCLHTREESVVDGGLFMFQGRTAIARLKPFYSAVGNHGSLH